MLVKLAGSAQPRRRAANTVGRSVIDNTVVGPELNPGVVVVSYQACRGGEQETERQADGSCGSNPHCSLPYRSYSPDLKTKLRRPRLGG